MTIPSKGSLFYKYRLSLNNRVIGMTNASIFSGMKSFALTIPSKDSLFYKYRLSLNNRVIGMTNASIFSGMKSFALTTITV